MVMMMVGFQDPEIDSSVPVPVNAVLVTVRSTAWAAVGCPGVPPPRSPVTAVAGPDQYRIEVLGIVSLLVRAPVVKTVADTVAVNDGAIAPVAVTVTVPSWADTVPEPVAAEPRFFDVGAVMATAAPAGDAAATTTSASASASAAVRRARLTAGKTPQCQARGPGTVVEVLVSGGN